MKKFVNLLLVAVFLAAGCGEEYTTPAPAPPPPPLPPVEETPNEGGEQGGNENQEPEVPFKDVTLAAQFKEDFSEKSSGFLKFAPKSNGDDFRYYSGHPSLSENNTKIMMMRVDPTDGEGWGKGPQVTTKDYTFYGSYSSRMRVPNTKKAQKNLGGVVGLYTYDTDEEFGQTEIDIELRISDPTIIYLSAWTGKGAELNRISRTINLATGTIIDCSYGTGTTEKGKLTDAQNMPATISAISDFDASKKFHTYGFDWKPDRITWWIIPGGKTEKVILWDYEGKELFPESNAPAGIPVIPAYCTSSFWHSTTRLADKLTNAKEAPKYPFELEIDWMTYEPFEDLNNKWFEEGRK